MKITVFSCIQFIYFMSGESSLQAEINIPSVQLCIVYVTDVTDVGTRNNLISISE